MKDEMSALDVYHMVEELKHFEGGKIEKVYEWEDSTFLFRLYARGNKSQLRVVLPGLFYLTPKRLKAPKMPPGFCRFLRKHVGGGRIESVDQKGFDRIIEITLSTKHGERILLLELFKPSNIIVLDEERNIIHPYNKQSFKDRQVKSRHPYSYPPGQPPIQSFNVEDAKNLFEKGELARVLATTFGLGGRYATEVVHRCELQPDTAVETLSDQQCKRIHTTIQSLFLEKEPCVIGDEAFPVQMHSRDKGETYETFSEAVDSLFSFEQVITSKPQQPKRNKWEAIIRAQKQQVQTFEKNIRENQNKAEWLYEHYQDVKKLLKLLQSHASEGTIQEVIDEHDYIIAYDPETKEVTIDV